MAPKKGVYSRETTGQIQLVNLAHFWLDGAIAGAVISAYCQLDAKRCVHWPGAVNTHFVTKILTTYPQERLIPKPLYTSPASTQKLNISC
jgi:hypothetical protein